MKDGNHVIISVDVGKALDKMQHPLRIKTHNREGIEGTYLSTTKTVYGKPTANVILRKKDKSHEFRYNFSQSNGIDQKRRDD